jgi:exo-beta-1,3-glucanase (GH17 family)
MNARFSTAIELARRYPNVTRLVVGNETMFRKEQTAASLARIIRRVKRDSPVPVATADHWKFFLDHPELVDALDQVFAHILPYWEGISKNSAVDGILFKRAMLPTRPPLMLSRNRIVASMLSSIAQAYWRATRNMRLLPS